VDDAPPTVALTSPTAGVTGAGGTTVPIRWNAWDDDSVRAVHLQVSTDGGRTWSFIARDLPGNTNAYDWRVPLTTGSFDARVKVIAVDERFQDTSDGSDISFSIVPGSPAPGEAGEAGATGPMTAGRGAGTSVLVEYTPACAATDHVVYWGAGSLAGGPQWAGSACGLGSDGNTSFDPGTPPPGELVYFVIVGQDASSEGSYGKSSSGTERPEAIGVGACDRPRTIGICQP
jgi:hypothetical protein